VTSAPTCQECGEILGQPHNNCCDEVLGGNLPTGALVTEADCARHEVEVVSIEVNGGQAFAARCVPCDDWYGPWRVEQLGTAEGAARSAAARDGIAHEESR
jgi:hypothetical protein